MTRDEAIKKVAHATNKDFGRPTIDFNGADVFTRGLEALGLIKFEEPKSEDDLLTEALRAAWWAAGQKNATHGPLAINKVLLNAGFKIVRA